MDPAEVLAILKEILLGIFTADLEADEILPDSNFVEDLGVDSLDKVEIVLAVEEEFGIDIPDADAERLRTVQNLVDYVVEASE